MGMLKEFRDFAIRGNVVDLAVGIILGGAFGKIVSSLVADVIMPPIGLLMGKVDFSQLKIVFQQGTPDAAGKIVGEVALRYGLFINTIIDFVLVAFAVFALIKVIN